MVSAAERRWRAAHGAAVGFMKQAGKSRTGRKKGPARRGFSAAAAGAFGMADGALAGLLEC